jgi:hypothetical protein
MGSVAARTDVLVGDIEFRFFWSMTISCGCELDRVVGSGR